MTIFSWKTFFKNFINSFVHISLRNFLSLYSSTIDGSISSIDTRVVHRDGNNNVLQRRIIVRIQHKKRIMFPPPYELIECIDLFNILNAEINGLARISDTNYLYLLGLYYFSH